MWLLLIEWQLQHLRLLYVVLKLTNCLHLLLVVCQHRVEHQHLSTRNVAKLQLQLCLHVQPCNVNQVLLLHLRVLHHQLCAQLHRLLCVVRRLLLVRLRHIALLRQQLALLVVGSVAEAVVEVVLLAVPLLQLAVDNR